MEHLVTVGSDGKILLNYAYAYDGNGNCTKKSGDVYQNAYGYDVMNRLSEATYHGDTEQFTYDLAGNRLTRKTQTGEERYEYNCKNQLTGLEKESDHMVYLYDKQGNLLSEQGKDVSRTYAYDPLNRQYSVTTEKGAASYRYDGEGLRYETEEAGKVIRFVFDRGELAAEESGSEQKRYCRGHHVVSLQSAREDSPHYFVCVEMGSTIFLLDQEQEIRKSYHYDPFGSIIETSGSIENRITYTGQMYDGISGQYYLRARFYNPRIGRFMQEDAYRGDGLNLYAYCQNNPITYYDPSGYLGLCPAGKSNPQAEQTEGSGDPIKGGSNVKIDTYKNMVKDPTVTGQAHHLSQDAAFRDVIPKQEGLSIELEGNAFTDIGSQHYNAHNSLEGFWNNYRKGGDFYGEMPTVGEYNRALYNSLGNAGISKMDSAYSVLEAFKQQRGFGLSNTDFVPRIPGRINQIK